MHIRYYGRTEPLCNCLVDRINLPDVHKYLVVGYVSCKRCVSSSLCSMYVETALLPDNNCMYYWKNTGSDALPCGW